VRDSQTNNLFGKLLMWTTFAGVAFIRSTSDLEQYKELLKEARAVRCVAAGRVACLAAQRLLGACVCVLTCALLFRTQATFYDKQWSATWDGVQRPSEKEN
jgi:hypothetical protein